MGVLSKMGASPELVIVEETASVPAEVFEKPTPPSLMPAPVQKPKELEIKRDMHGTIESVTGYDREGQRVRFDFERDGRRQLEKIKVR